MSNVMIGSCSTAGRNLRVNSSSRAGKYLSTNCGGGKSAKLKSKVNKLQLLALKQFPGSINQKKTIKQLYKYKNRLS